MNMRDISKTLKKEHVNNSSFTISIDDTFCEWSFSITEIGKDYSISDIMHKITKALNCTITNAKQRSTNNSMPIKELMLKL